MKTKNFKLDGVTVSLSKEQLQDMLASYDKPEFEYPLVFKNRSDDSVVLFKGLIEGECIYSAQSTFTLGYKSKHFIPHTNSDCWEPVPYDKERELFDKQPVVVWDNDDVSIRWIKFYDVKNSSVFTHDGTRGGDVWNNIKPYHGDLFGMSL